MNFYKGFTHGRHEQIRPTGSIGVVPRLKGQSFSGREVWTNAKVKGEVRGQWPGWSEVSQLGNVVQGVEQWKR